MKITSICAFLLIFCMFSCKKERTCQCTNSNGTYDSGTLESSKSYAKKYCKTLSVGETACALKQ
ncbi:MAG: hypothetical protein H7141_12250 [Burkholderiales bacterium]|nr:hypothetical protein [Bacteroidia bacterium]